MLSADARKGDENTRAETTGRSSPFRAASLNGPRTEEQAFQTVVRLHHEVSILSRGGHPPPCQLS